MTLRMTDSNGKNHLWIISERRQYTNLTRANRPRKFYGYSFTDHEGYVRIVEGNWHNLVSELKFIAGNYGFTCVLS